MRSYRMARTPTTVGRRASSSNQHARWHPCARRAAFAHASCQPASVSVHMHHRHRHPPDDRTRRAGGAANAASAGDAGGVIIAHRWATPRHRRAALHLPCRVSGCRRAGHGALHQHRAGETHGGGQLAHAGPRGSDARGLGAGRRTNGSIHAQRQLDRRHAAHRHRRHAAGGGALSRCAARRPDHPARFHPRLDRIRRQLPGSCAAMAGGGGPSRRQGAGDVGCAGTGHTSRDREWHAARGVA